MVLGYLISPVVQIVDNHGKPIVGAKIYVYKAGTTNTVNTYRDFSNHYNTTPVLTNTLGNCTIIASDDMVYDIVVKDNRNNLLMSKDNLTVSSGVNPDINLRFREGYGIIIRKNGNTVTIAIDTDVVATKDDLATKQDKLTAGDNIEITNDNTVNVVNRKTLYTQWPLKVDRGSSMVKLYLDQDFVDNNADILPGVDLAATYDELGRQIIGVDTNGVVSGDYNFVAGYNTYANGNYNFVAGAGCSATGNRNTVFGYDNAAYEYSNFAIGANNSVSGSCNFVGGQNNEAKGTANTVFGVGNSISNNTYNCNTIIGQYATQGDYYFAIGNGNQNTRSNVFEVRKDGSTYYKYNNNMIQLAPYTAGSGISISNNQISVANISIETLDFIILNTDHILTNDDITNKGFSITIPGTIDYWDWCANALITSAPIATIFIGTYYSEGVGEVIHSWITNIFEGGSQNSFARNEQTLYGTGITYLRTWPSSKPLGLDYQKLEVAWTGNLLTVGDKFTCSIIIQPSKLVIS